MAKAKAAKQDMPILDPDHVPDDLFNGVGGDGLDSDAVDDGMDVVPDAELQQLVFQQSADGQLILPGSTSAAEGPPPAKLDGVGQAVQPVQVPISPKSLTVPVMSQSPETALAEVIIPERRVQFVMLKVPLREIPASDNSYKTNKLNVALNATQAQTLRSLTDALNRCDSRTDDNRHVAKEIHAIRWFLDQLADLFATEAGKN